MQKNIIFANRYLVGLFPQDQDMLFYSTIVFFLGMRIDKQMMEHFQRGDLESFYMEIYPSLLRYATRVLGKTYSHLAEDCIQDAIFKVYQKRKHFDKPSEMKAYLFTSVHNQIVDIFRKNDLQEQYTNNKEWIEKSPIDSFLLQETLDILYKAISKLPDELKTIYEMSYEQQMKGMEIADKLNISKSKVTRLKQRLIEVLRQQFKDNDLMQIIITIVMSDNLL